MLTIRMATDADVDFIASWLNGVQNPNRPASMISAERALRENLRSPDPCFVAVNDRGSPVLIFGTAPHHERAGAGAVWLVAVEPMRPYRAFLRTEAARHLRLFHQKYSTISSYADRKNAIYQRWLRELGFTFRRAVTDGSNPILEYVRTRQCANQYQ